MKCRKWFPFFFAACCGAFYWAAPARAQLPPPPIPPDFLQFSDTWVSSTPAGGYLGPFGITQAQEQPNGFFANTGIQTGSANGTAIALTENASASSDYVYAVAGFLYFSSDNETGVIPIHPAIPGGVAGLNIVASYAQDGNWREITQNFILIPGTQAWVASDPEVPEPVSGAILAGAFGLLALRRRVHK